MLHLRHYTIKVIQTDKFYLVKFFINRITLMHIVVCLVTFALD